MHCSILHIPMDPNEAMVDTTRPFRSVKEAVAVFGERILTGDANLRKHNDTKEVPKAPPISININHPPSSPSFSSPSFASLHNEDDSVNDAITAMLKKLQGELEDTKQEVVLLKEKGSDMEVIVASLDAEIRKNSLKLAEMEGEGANDNLARYGKDLNYDRYLPTLSHVLSLGEIECEFENERKERRRRKKKPIVPLIGDVFSTTKKNKNGSERSSRQPSLYSPSFSGILS